MTAREKNIARIKALLEKNTDNGATEAEAMSALAKAHQLMKDWYISEHEINDPYLGEKCILKEVPLIRTCYDCTLFYNDLVRLFDCEYFYTSRRITFFGFEEDVELCGYFYNLIIKSCLKEKDNYLKSAEGIVAKKRHHGRTLAASFIKGFLFKVSDKMENLYKDKISNIPPQSGLMIIKKESKVKEQFANFNFDIKMSSKKILFEEMGFAAGEEKGSAFQLVQAVKKYSPENILMIN